MFAFTAIPVFRTSSFTGALPCVRSINPTATDRLSCHVRHQSPRAQLIGIPDNLRSNVDPSAHEVLLGEFRFSDPSRLPALIESSLDLLNEDFYKFLETTINNSVDMEERETLRALRDAITSIMGQMMEALSEQERQQDQVIDTAASPLSSSETPTQSSTSATTVQQSFDELIDLMLQSYDDGDASSINTAVDLHYHRIDISFLERLSERIVSAGDGAPRLSRLRDAISDVMNERVSIAMSSLKTVLSSGAPDAMRTAIGVLARQGRIDDAFILLLQANVEQAGKAGAVDAVKVLTDLLEYALDVKDTEAEPEVRLIRVLLRTDDVETRNKLLTESFQATTPVLLPDGTKSISTKVDGKKYVTALRKLIEEFGNVDEKFVLKLSKIGEESEAVARKIFDMEGKEVEQLQEEAFHKRSVSVWDLEEYEHKETGEGRTAPWEGRLGTIPEEMGFGQDGKLSV